MIPDTYPPAYDDQFEDGSPASPFAIPSSDLDPMIWPGDEHVEHDDEHIEHYELCDADHVEAGYEDGETDGHEFGNDGTEAERAGKGWPDRSTEAEAQHPLAGELLAGSGFLDDEAEAFLGNLWDSTKAVWEKALVGMAIARGQRDSNELTNLVFFRRYPDRQGRPLTPSEPRFRELAREWTAIRDSIVVPALSGASSVSPTPVGEPGRAPAGSSSPIGGDWARVRGNLVAVANRELAFWSNGALKEWDQRGWKRVEQYWSGSIGSWRPKGRHGHDLATKHAWSAVFICWAVRQAGVDATTFRARANHSNYMVDLIRAATRSPNHPVTVVSPYSAPIRQGDMINNWRRSHFDVDRLRKVAAGRKFPHWPSHTDIVVEVVPGSHAWVIGGNKGHSVKRVKATIDHNGVLAPGRWTAVIRMGP